ncbi:reverse transcriptase-like protein [Candidatus Microgenomates bacterium]|nr:MAG: reverse transcriptase-like protein [Candidatus Microgenomates bacterium]
MKHVKLIIHTDGGARGNPGPAGIGAVIESEQELQRTLVHELSETIGETTNNVAEYMAVLKAFAYLLANNMQATEMQVYLDSRLVAEQLAGRFKIKKPHLYDLFVQVKELENKVGERVSYFAIPRSENARADALVNQALDELLLC